MAYVVPNVRVLVQVGKYSSQSLVVPEYEIAILRAAHGARASQATRFPDKGSRHSKCPITGRDRYHGLRSHTLDSLRLEYDRLVSKYSPGVIGEEDADAKNPALQVFPTYALFAQAAKAAYPDILGAVTVATETVAAAPEDLEDGEDSLEEEEPLMDIPAPEEEAPAPVAEVPAASDEFGAVGPDVSALEQLNYIDHDDAVDLFNAGFQSLEDVAKASPEAIAAAVHGVGVKRAREIIDQATDLSLE